GSVAHTQGFSTGVGVMLVERFGVRPVVVAALATIAGSSLFTTVMTEPWELFLLWGSSTAAPRAPSRCRWRRSSPTAGSYDGGASSRVCSRRATTASPPAPGGFGAALPGLWLSG